MNTVPRIAITMGDVAGIGPEVAVAACMDESLKSVCQLMLIGDADVAERAAKLLNSDLQFTVVDGPNFDAPTGSVACWDPAIDSKAANVPSGIADPRSGKAAFEWLSAAITAALAGEIDAITTAPLNKYALHKAGHNFPGHTEILAEQCGVDEFAMMLYLPADALQGIRQIVGQHDSNNGGLGIAHVTLHTSVDSVPGILSAEVVMDKIRLMHDFLGHIDSRKHIAVTALNPHAGEDGLFGNEEAIIIKPAVEAARSVNIHAEGPFPTDTLIRRAIRGEFDGVVAMYHDQGHIPFKLIGFDRAVNITLGLPIVRTSPSHGTAFDIAWQGKANPQGMVESIRLAAQLANSRRTQKDKTDRKQTNR